MRGWGKGETQNKGGMNQKKILTRKVAGDCKNNRGWRGWDMKERKGRNEREKIEA